METCKVYLLNSKDEVQYGLNWGQRENRDPNQSYLQLDPEVYNSDFFPVKGKYFIVETDDNETIIFNRAQKEKGCALQTPENNSILGRYIRKRLGVKDSAEIVKDDILRFGKNFIVFTKIDDMHYKLGFSNNTVYGKITINLPFQQILFGAPGTGKSHTLNSDAHITEQNSIRTTFHPDSDYSTFVGCYKPTKKERRNVELVKLDELVKLSKTRTDTESRVKFIREYAESIKAAATDKGLSDNQIIKGDDYFGWNSDTYLKCFLDEILEERSKTDDSEITYEFVPQAFTKAYVAAWKNLDEPFFLIIEEINRGNCAQIFGDIFQLLDRNESGFSSYKIDPDQDLRNYIKKQLSDCESLNEKFAYIKSGEKMMLPDNLYIWATMNTSDQSLFPIDSAFKRRWDWRYIPISYTDNGHYISCGDIPYSWVDFLRKVNDRVESVTQSEDKKLGYWFMGNGKEQKEITIDRFVSKVIFYLWNDIFKDFGKSGNTIFKDTFDKFHKFFDDNGKPKVDIVKAFLDNLGVVNVNVEKDDEDKTKIDYTKYTFDGESKLTKRALGSKIIRKFLEEHKDLDYASILEKLSFDESVIKDRVAGVVAKEGEIKDRDNASYSKDSFTSHDGVKYRILEYWTKYNINFIINFAKGQGWSVTEE